MENQKDQPTNNHSSRNKTQTGIFIDADSDTSLKERGYTQEAIDVGMSDQTKKKHSNNSIRNQEPGNKTMESIGKGATMGGAIGAIAGVIAAIGTNLIIPELNLVIAGPVAAGLAGVGAGGITGGLIAALVSSGISEERVKKYEEDIKKGRIVMRDKPRKDDDITKREKEWMNEVNDQIKDTVNQSSKF